MKNADIKLKKFDKECRKTNVNSIINFLSSK